MIHKRTSPLCKILLSIPFLAFTSSAYADDCLTLAENKTWNSGLDTLNTQITQKRWDESLKTAENLSLICERSPILNYLTGRIYREKGDDKKALYYMQRATLYTEEFSVKGRALERMWFDRYEAEHPEARPEAIAAMQQENAQLKARLQQSHDNTVDARFGDLMTDRTRYGAGLWTGVAVAGVGLVLTGVGAGLIVANKDDTIEFGKEEVDSDKAKNDQDSYYIKPSTKAQNNAYWGMLGAGIAATVVGVTLTGIFGYWYSHTGVEIEDNSISFYSTSNGIGIRF